jgi:hypothetical protein
LRLLKGKHGLFLSCTGCDPVREGGLCKVFMGERYYNFEDGSGSNTKALYIDMRIVKKE